MVFLALAVASPAATGQQDAGAFGILDRTGVSARLVRHGSGSRLYHTGGRLTISSRRAEFVPERAGIHLRMAFRRDGGCRTVASRTAGSWTLVAESANLPFPELLALPDFDRRFKESAKPGTYTPRSSEDRKLLDRITVTRDRAGRPERVMLWWAGGDLEVREYSNWAEMAPVIIDVPLPERSVVWPPEKVWGSHLENALETLDQQLGKLEDLSGTFIREKRTLLLNRPVRATGRFVFVPGRLLWIDEQPRKVEVLITRGGMEIHDPGNRRLERFSFGGHALGRYVFLGFGDSLAEGLRGLDPVVFERTGDELRLELVPVRGELGKHVKRISFRFDIRTGMIRQLGYSDPAGDSVTTTFTTIEKNTGMDPEAVSIRPAAGTKIVESRGGMPWR